MNRKDLIGKRFGHLTVQKMLYHYKGDKHTYCECVCDCGNKTIIEATHLQRRSNPSCGCMSSYYRTIHNRTDETGNKYGRLKILSIDYSQTPSKAICECDCGNIIKVSKVDVVSSHTKSCGCLQKEMASLSNTKDFTDIVFDNGVKALSQSHKNEHGVWLWNCICPLCGNIFQALPAAISLNNVSSCGCKIQSSKERIIESILNDLNIKYEKQKRFDDCKYKYTLPFDFAVYNSDDTLNCLIEYDGEQHFRAVDFFGGEEGYKATKIRDEIKTNYCNKNNYKLIRLNYQHSLDEIKSILTNILNP